MTLDQNLLQWLAGAGATAVISLIYYAWSLSSRLTTLETTKVDREDFSEIIDRLSALEAVVRSLETTVKSHEKFNETLMQRMVTLLISPHSAEFDRVLLSLKRGEKMSREEWLLVHNELEREYVELLKGDTEIEHAKERQIMLAIVIGWVEGMRQKI